MYSIEVKTSKNYIVTVSEDFASLRDVVDGVKKGNNIAIITDTNVERLYVDTLRDILSGYNIYVHTIPAGESSKNFANYVSLVEAIAKDGLDRSDMLITIGGGVVGDIGAFVASTYLRGIRLVAVPTSLLAMIDSSIGGKTAIDLSVGKNLCGTFYQPNAVYINVACLDTLPKRELMSGYGELIKYAILDSRISIEDMKVLDASLVAKAVSIKRDIVELDEYESGPRKLLNLGHTIGHAVESLSGYTLSHGESVVKGLKAVLDIAKLHYDMTDDAYAEILSLITLMGHDTSIEYSIEDILEVVSHDKKKYASTIDMVLPRGIAEVEIVALSLSEFRRYMSEYRC